MTRYATIPAEVVDREIKLACLGLLAGLPDRCCCPAPVAVEEQTREVELCGNCGGLIATRVERVEAA